MQAEEALVWGTSKVRGSAENLEKPEIKNDTYAIKVMRTGQQLELKKHWYINVIAKVSPPSRAELWKTNRFFL